MVIVEFFQAFGHVLVIETRRSFRMTLRYKAEAFVSFLFLLSLFYGVLLGIKVSSGAQLGLGQGNESFLIGFLCWVLVTGGLTHVADDIEEEAKTGTLEPLFMSSFHPTLIFLARSFSSLVVGAPILIALALILYSTTGVKFNIGAHAIAPLIAIDFSANGLGFILGGLALRLKRVRMIIVAAQLGSLAAMLPHDGVFINKGLSVVLPLVPAIDALRAILVEGRTLLWGEQLMLIFNGVAYLVLGIAVFLVSIRNSRKNGSLGQH